MSDPRTYLARFSDRLDARIRHLEARSQGYSRVRIVLFLLATLATFLVFRETEDAWRWLVPAVAFVAFLFLARSHERVVASIRRHEVYRDLKRAHAARRARNWAGLPDTAQAASPEHHAFGGDLDVLGPRSLHHLLDTSFSEGGSRLLADWLTDAGSRLNPERQRLVRELVRYGALRDRISLLSAVTAGKAGERFSGDVLTAWLGRPGDEARMRPILLVLTGLAGLTASLAALDILLGLGGWWAMSLVAYVAVYLLNSRLYSELFDEAEHLHYQLERFRPVVDRLERFRAPEGSALWQLLTPFRQEARPSRYLRRVRWLSVAASAQKNEILRVVLNLALPWDLLFAYRLAHCKRELHGLLPMWLGAVYRLEAAGSLATYAALNPECAFPEPTDGGVGLRAVGLGHPLLPPERSVRNDFEMTGPGQLTLVTGSNMSGKSTFLRSLGLARVMAMAGGPVEARRWQAGPMRLFTCMGVHDSVTDGISFFYAEVKRLGRLMEAVRAPSEQPILVLIDEIFRGTNNRERLLGSRELLCELVARGAMGVVATHDLELVALQDELAGFRNLHFREEVEGGRMVFDYALRAGPCPTTNALKIMALEGLPVPAAGQAPAPRPAPGVGPGSAGRS